jgi:CubicO group peptidase (beta-lactamase class C family)
MRRPVRLVLILAATLVAVGVASFVAVSIIYSPGYAIRFLLWQEADVGDFARFPSRTIEAADTTFSFDRPADPTAARDQVGRAAAASSVVNTDLESFLESTGTQALLVIREDEILYEHYAATFARDSIATSFSTAKSYLSALVGIAIDEGAIDSVDDPITDYLPELIARDARFGDITIRQLLDMASGIHYEENGFINGDDTLTYYFDDLRALALERTTIDRPPGERWQYNNYHPLLLGQILERTTGMSVADYLEDRLWRRIGTEFPASWSLDRDGGIEKLESGLNARPIDFAKLGRLYLDGGSWSGDQVVPQEWVEASTSAADSVDRPSYYPPRMEQPFGAVSHQMMWWRIRGTDGIDAFSAVGNHGQYIFVAPAQRLIIVRSGERYGVPSMDWLRLFTEMARGLNDC